MSNTYTLSKVEEILKGRISKNPHRFEEANGIVFTVRIMDEVVENYFLHRGIEIYKLDENTYYTETLMSGVEFSDLDYITSFDRVA